MHANPTQMPSNARPTRAYAVHRARRCIGTCVAAITCAGYGVAARAQEVHPSLEQLAHTAWTLRDGAPPGVRAIAQTADGFLWLATSQGLFRFDGVRFERYEPAAGQALTSSNISTLLVLPGDSLWIGYTFGGASVLAADRLLHYGRAEGLPPSTVRQFARDSSGGVWAATQGGLFERVGGRWRRVSGEHGLPGGIANGLLFDRRGTLWVTLRELGVFARRRGERDFAHLAPSLGDVSRPALQETRDGSVWGASMTRGLVRLADSIGAPDAADATSNVAANGDSSMALLIDPSGAAWLPGLRGLGWIATATSTGRPEARAAARHAFTRLQGLSGKSAWTVFRDREGSVWVGTTGGVDRFRATKLTAVQLPPAVLFPSVVARDRGGVWVASPNYPLLEVGDSVVVRSAAPSDIECAYRDLDGDVWLGGNAGAVWRGHGGAFTPVAMPAAAKVRNVQAIARDRADRLWVSVQDSGVFRRDGGLWRRFDASGQIKGPAMTIVADSGGRTWLGYPANRLARVSGDGMRVFTSADGLRVGNVAAIYVHGDRVWLGGDLGVRYLDAAEERPRALPLVTVDGPIRGVSGIVETADGELWLNGTEGVTRVPAAELRRALRDSTYAVQAERFDFRDGVDGMPAQIRGLPTAVQSADGRLWFSTTDGLTWLDPTRVRRNPLAPPVRIRALKAGNRRYPVAERITLPTRTRAVSIAYTALSLAVPERVRFRYRLVGVDSGWQDAGARREAFYTNLGPGAYQFRVIAANDDGVWNEAGATLGVVIPPTFVQTQAFLALCAVSAAGVLWLLVQWRHRQLARAIRERYDIALAERTRIAQELHDTLLQGFTGVTLQVHAARTILRARPDDASDALERAVASANATLRDARHAVSEMRAPELDACDLPDALAMAAREAVGSAPIRLHVAVHGARRRLARVVEVTALRIGREAVLNAVRHAGAGAVELTLAFEARAITLRVRDDGCGMTPAALERARAGGHWGVVGMRERATSAGGSLDITSSPGAGTLIVVTLPVIEADRRRAESRRPASVQHRALLPGLRDG